MVLYLSIVFVAMLLIAGINIICGTASLWFVVLMVVATTAFQFAIDGVFAFVIARLPNRFFGLGKKCFKVSNKTQRFYEKLQIKKWKDKVWELGKTNGFSKSKLDQPKNSAYIERFIIECNKGVVVHRVGYFVGFLGIFLFPLKYAFAIGVPIALVNLFLNALPTMILRYNVPKLTAVYERLKLRESKVEK